MKELSKLFIGLFVASSIFSGAVAFADDDEREGKRYEVTITNVTRGQVLTPPVLFSHRQGFKVFEVGSPASPALIPLAEDGMTTDLLAELSASSKVYDLTASPGPILPGQSRTLEISIKGKFRYLSTLGMLATTNDGFFAATGIRPPKKGMKSVGAMVYDAGSEVNNEACPFIPGPPCGSPGIRMTDGAEGFVHVHAGIHGTQDLVPSMHDWNNPAAHITIKRIRD